MHRIAARILGCALLSGVALLIEAPGHANAAIYDSLADFAASSIAQGGRKATVGSSPTLAVEAGRSDVGKMFDGNAASFYSFGLAGSAGPAEAWFRVHSGETISAGTVIEVTNIGGEDHEEALGVYLGTQANPFLNLIGYFLNKDAGAGGTTAAVATSGFSIATGLATLSAANVSGTDGGSFEISGIVGAFSTIGFRDASGGTRNPLSLNGRSLDGFDIGELRVSTVPLPAAAWLFGSAFLALCWLGRRNATGGVGMLPRDGQGNAA